LDLEGVELGGQLIDEEVGIEGLFPEEGMPAEDEGPIS
jgi:hypothetical protein